MLKISIKLVALICVLIGWVAGTHVAAAQPSVTLLEYDSSWSYFTNGTDLGTEWRATDYDDSAWPSGPVFAGSTKMRWMCRSLKRQRPSPART